MYGYGPPPAPPPWGQPQHVPPQDPPGTLRAQILGVFGMVLAGIAILWEGMKLGIGFLFADAPVKLGSAAVEDAALVMARFTAISSGTMIVLSFAIAIIGALLFRSSERGRIAALVWAVLALGYLVLRAVGYALFVAPALAKAGKAILSHFVSTPMPMRPAYDGELPTLMLLALFPIAILVLLSTVRFQR